MNECVSCVARDCLVERETVNAERERDVTLALALAGPEINHQPINSGQRNSTGLNLLGTTAPSPKLLVFDLINSEE
jgi:hypothetical protein